MGAPPFEANPMTSLARELCQQIDWQYPALARTAAAQAYRANDCETAALEFVHYLRQRRRPFCGYSPAYVAALRRHATPAFRRQAQAELSRLRTVPFLGGDHPDGRGTLLAARPEVLQVAGTPADFEEFARRVAASQPRWDKSAKHTIFQLARFLPAVFPLAECSDEALLPVFGWLTTIFPTEWAEARTWGDTMLGPSGHNWWVAQLGATWIHALLFPEFRGFTKFRAFFPDWFEREIQLLTHSDGFTRECTVAYHLATTAAFIEVSRLAAANGLRLSPAFHERLRRMAAVEWKLVQPTGHYPAFGDIHNLEPFLFQRVPSLAALTGSPEMKWLAEHLAPRRPRPFGKLLIETLQFPSVGEDLAPRYRRIKARAPATLDTALPASGIFVMRQNWTRQADYAALDASARGNIVSSHGHGAIFDLMLVCRGRAITVGNGKGPDVGMDEPRRHWRVKSESHTVATMDGEDHLPWRRAYRFANHVSPTIEVWRSEPGFAYFSGAHEAYERLGDRGAVCRRKLFYRRGRYWILMDRFGVANVTQTHTYRQHFQLGVPARVLANGQVTTTGRGGNLLFVPVAGVPSLAPCPWPLEGYFNPRQLVFTQPNVTGHGLFVTVLVPFRDTARPNVQARLLPVMADDRELSPWEATGLEIVINGRREVYVDFHVTWYLPWKCGGHTGQHRLFHSTVLR
ncbi:MAG: hypothetical protein PCFJNLEI_01665 [Verrucomicrobiae bacterium]|nr:hypothetical protein [Verrucomicrobiae bacterium]